MTRYPSSADLAAFRRSYPVSNRWIRSLTVPTDGGAWQDELRHGIGYRITDARYPSEWESLPEDRRGASALRSRAYARACAAASPSPCADCGAIGWHTRACRADWPAL